MTNPLKLIGVLTIICIVSALSLSYVHNEITAPIIAERAKQKAVEVLKDLVTGADDFEIILDEDGNIAHYEVIIGGEVALVAMPTEATGFAAAVKLIVVTDMEGIITAVSVASQSETPGYGDRIINEPEFIEQFEGMSLLESEFAFGSDIDILVGATVTCDAVVTALKRASVYFVKNFVEGNKEVTKQTEGYAGIESVIFAISSKSYGNIVKGAWQ